MKKLISLLIYLAYRAIGLTYRYRYYRQNIYEEARNLHPNGLYIFALWHQNIFGGIQSKIHEPHMTMASRSKDGEIIAQVLLRLNYIPVRGSSSRGGRKAMGEMIDLLHKKEQTYSAALTVDGPRGPAKEVKAGVIQIARKCRIPIIPYTAIPLKYWELKSWDRFRIPRPFTSIHCTYGHPVMVPEDLKEEEFDLYCQKVKNSLLESEDYLNHLFQEKGWKADSLQEA